MKLNGSTRQGATYLAADIIRAERGFRADPACFLYIPLRIMIAETEQGTGQISFDVPGRRGGWQDARSAAGTPRGTGAVRSGRHGGRLGSLAGASVG